MDQLPNTFPTVHEAASLVRRQARLIALSVVLGVGGALIYVSLVPPLYTATALLFADPSQKNLLRADDQYSAQSSVENARVESEVEILRSDTVALATAEKLNLMRDPEFGPQLGLGEKLMHAIGEWGPEDRDGAMLVRQTLDRFDKATTIRRRGLTYILAVSVSSRLPDRAAELANTLAQTYIDLQVQSKIDASLVAGQLLRDQIERSRSELAASENTLDTYIDANLTRLQLETGSSDLVDLREQLSWANKARQTAESTAANAQRAMARDDVASLVQSLGDDALAELAQQRFQLEVRLGASVAGTPDDIDLRARLADIGDSISGYATVAIGALEDDVRLLTNEAGDYRAQIRQAVLGGSLSSATVAQIYALQQEADVAQRQYSMLLSRLRDVESQALVQVADGRIVSHALAPADPSFPKAGAILGMAVIVSLGFGVGLAFANEYYFGGVTSTLQLANIVPGTVPASVPALREKRGMLSVADRVVNAPLCVFSESLRRVRSRIDGEMHNAKGPCTVIMVSSSIPGEGKTTIALALARTYAMAGRRTLLIDADLRKPSLHNHLGLPRQTGLLDHLKEQAGGPVHYIGDPLSDAQVVLGGERSDMPTDCLLDSERFDDILQDACNGMDIVIVDTSPVIPIVDARYIARRADVIVQCVGYVTTGVGDVRHGHADLVDSARRGTSIIVVLNRDETKVKSYHYNGYGAGEIVA